MRTAARKPVENRDLIERIDSLLQGRRVEFAWTRGHAGHPLNEGGRAGERAARRAEERLAVEHRNVGSAR
jgi:ribonuclease HI